jgi:hypothetical protein
MNKTAIPAVFANRYLLVSAVTAHFRNMVATAALCGALAVQGLQRTFKPLGWE